MYLLNLLQRSKIESLGYSSVYLERPVPSIIEINWKTILSAPPSNISQITAKELNFLASETLARSPEQIKNIHYVDENLDDPFEKLLNQYNISYPQEYIDIFYEVIKPVLYNIKSLWNRPRPFQLAKLYGIRIDPIYTLTIDTASYPSGHTVYSRLVRNILADKYPNLTSKLNGIVTNTAKARVQQGVHYPSDNNASIILSDTLYQHLKTKIKDINNE